MIYSHNNKCRLQFQNLEYNRFELNQVHNSLRVERGGVLHGETIT